MRQGHRGRSIIARPRGIGLPPAVVSVEPSLGDLYGGVRLTLTVQGTVTGVSVGGAPCTNVVQTGETVRCTSPQTTAGLKAIVVSGAGGDSEPLTNAYEAWHPTVDYPAARVYQADQGVTSAGTATRHRFGATSYDSMAGAKYGAHRPGPDPAPNTFIAAGSNLATDGQGMVELPSGRILLAGGAPAGHAYQVVNTIWKSDDRCKTFQELLPDRPASSTCPAPAHTWGLFRMAYGGTDYVYSLGGDPFTPTGDVFRIPCSALDVGGNPNTAWERVSTTCPTSGLALFLYGHLAGVIYVGAGQTSIQDSGTVSKAWHKSTDGGATWTSMGNIVPANVYGAQLGPLPVKDGKLWIASSGRYHSTINEFSNAVVTFDGTNFATVLADGHGQFPKSRYHSVVVDSAGKLWRFNGTTWNGSVLVGDTKTAHYSSDGSTWTAYTDLPWNNTHAQAAIASSDGIYVTDGFQSARVFAVREHTGQLVSAWNDLGSAAKHLSQSDVTGAKKPIKDPSAFGSQPGLVFTRGQLLTLGAPDRGISGGVLEEYVFGKTTSFDTQATQGTNPSSTFVGAINGSSWNNFGTFVTNLAVNAASNASPIVIGTTDPHGLATGDVVPVFAVLGNTAANGKWTVTVLSATTFSLNGSTGNGTYQAGTGLAVVESLRYKHFASGWQTVSRASGICNDVARMMGVVQTASFVRLYTGAVQRGADAAGGFDTSWTGFDSVGAGYLESDYAELVLGAKVVLPHGVVSPNSFRIKLDMWGLKFS
jgi:hypothetical protein